MSSSNRRLFLLSALALGACGFTPAYGPQGAAHRLQGQVLVDAPDTHEAYLLTQRIEERLGRSTGGRYTLSVVIEVDSEGQAIASDGSTTRTRLLGRANYTLRDATGVALADRQIVAFTGYSATGSNVSILASQRNATAQLMVMLADRIIDQLILLSPDLTGTDGST
ncbi:LPS assembly lipoprotein LptE [Puniceibacterium sp. IMCC21224]|uniref:LPS assembly lipoprotein LptE n=1 Tax=Puniceibacterium sp. IMCC21224 TaxID=1618204 RepID=UPI00064DF91F|nr:LPS assembly lipoprotein LptE [Puniceibacterium sp. IMCC21224]KMK68735.1 Lipopolysaccharide-assembly [Puniceibacterium sp. IMCC21224]